MLYLLTSAFVFENEVFSIFLKIKCFCYGNRFGAAGGSDCRADPYHSGLNMPTPPPKPPHVPVVSPLDVLVK